MGPRILGPGDLADPLVYYVEAFSLSAAVCMVCFRFFGLYNPIKSLLNVREFYGVAKATAVAFFAVQVHLFFLRPSSTVSDGTFRVFFWLHERLQLHVDPNVISRATMVLAFLFIFATMMVGRFLSFRLIQHFHRSGIGHRNLLVIGAGPVARSLQRKFLLTPTLGLNLVGFVDEDPSRNDHSVGRARILGTVEDLPRLIEEHKVGEVIVARPDDPPEAIESLVESLENLGVEYSLVPRFYRLFDTGRVHISNVDATPLISRAHHRPNLWMLAGKRTGDIVISALFLVLALPLLLVLALAIKFDSKGPVLFWQTRIGRGGKPFRIAKFRTMYLDRCVDAVAPTSDADPRVTRVGRWLRRYSLDELPNFWNVC
ncbi:MAG: sugar transferase [Planctomycetota bacterium]